MKSNYPESLNPWFQGFYPQVRLRVGPELAGNGLDEGARVVLSETPSSRPGDLVYVEGEALPDYRAVYTDNGQDEGWSLKLEFYGWGSFFTVPGHPYYYLTLVKVVEISRSDWGQVKRFEKRQVVKTEFPSGFTIPPVQTGHVVSQQPGNEGVVGATQRTSGTSYTRAALSGADFKMNDDGQYYWTGTYTYA